MPRQLYYHFVIETHNEVGRLMAFLNRKVRRRADNDSGSLPVYVITLAVLKLIGLFLVRFAYIVLFMYVPMAVLGRICQAEGFQLQQSVVYFTVILTCICGSLINTGMFDMDDDAYMMLTTMQFDPADFFRGRTIFKLMTDGVFFLISYVIIGMDFPHAFYLVVWVLISRIIGEAVNLYVFRYTGKAIVEIPGLPAAIMIIAVLASYGFPFLRGHVVDLTGLVYDYLWLMVALIVAAMVGYGLTTYGGYAYVARRFINRMKWHAGKNKQESEAELELLAGEGNDERHFRSFENDNNRGSAYLHKIFFSRNSEYIHSAVFIRVMILTVVTISAVIVCRMSADRVKDIVWEALCGCLPIMVFIMYCMSVAPDICKALFYHIDSVLLMENYYRKRTVHFRNFIIRLRSIGELDLLLGLLLCIAMGIVGIATGHGEMLGDLTPVFFGIIFLSMFFSIFNLTVYYTCQPYNKELKARNYCYFAAKAGMLLIAYGCVYIHISASAFAILFGVITAAALSGCPTIIYYLSDKTFNIRNSRF